MKLTFSPIRMDMALVAEVRGDTLILNGEAYDFSPLPEAAVLPRDAVDCLWLTSDVTRCEGELELALVLPHGADAPQETLFPVPMRVVKDGILDLPPYETKEA